MLLLPDPLGKRVLVIYKEHVNLLSQLNCPGVLLHRSDNNGTTLTISDDKRDSHSGPEGNIFLAYAAKICFPTQQSLIRSPLHSQH